MRIRADTILKNFPLYCPKCKNETLVNAQRMNIATIEKPDVKTQNR